MKSDLTQSTVFSSLCDETSLKESMHESIIKYTQEKKEGIYCIRQKISKHGCMNKNCKKYAFVCQDDECQCQIEHEGCFITKTSTILKSINKKIVSIKPLEDGLNQAIDKLIDNLSKFRDDTILQIKKSFQFCGLNSEEINIFTSIRDGKVSKITGQDIWWSNLSGEQSISQILNGMKTFQTKVNQKMNNFSSITRSIKTQLSNFSQFHKKIVSQNEKIVLAKTSINPIKNFLKQMIFKNSKIVKTFGEIATIINFFEPKKLSKIYLLYRASDNDFCTKKFQDKCIEKKNTLVLCETKSGKKIGGFTPLQWNSIYSMRDMKHAAVTVMDQSNESFLFSLTHKDKFQLKEDKNAIVWCKEELKMGPCFGEQQDIVIRDKANTNFESYATLNGSYFNETYNLGGGKKDYKKFVGDVSKDREGKQIFFSLIEWQVWQVEFKV